MRAVRPYLRWCAWLTALASACAATSDCEGAALVTPVPESVATPSSPRTFPAVPVGADTLLQWDRLADLRIGTRTVMRGTWDRSGGNANADCCNYLRQEASYYVAFDLVGSGVLEFVRTNKWHGGPWHYVVDGRDAVVRDTSTDDPDHPAPDSQILPVSAFPEPLALAWPTTFGADISWVPVPFSSSFTLGMTGAHYGTGYYVAQLFPEGFSDASRPLRAWSIDDSPLPAVLDLVARAGEDIAPNGPGVDARAGTLDVPAGATALVLSLDGPRTLRALTFQVTGHDAAEALAHARLRVTWDDRAAPSIDAPLGLFFGAGSLYDRDGAEAIVKSLPMVVRVTPASPPVTSFATYFPMPFARRARVEIVGADAAVAGVAWSARSTALDEPSSWYGNLHATYVDHGDPVPGRDLLFLDTTKVEGGGDQCGSVVGTSFTFSDRGVFSTLEGDPRFYFDDSLTPQAQGTGTEEWAGGGDYWGGNIVTLPFSGHPVGAPFAGAIRAPEDGIESAYRLLVADAMPFGKNARLQFEHGGLDESTEHYTSIVYWYGHPGACLTLTDSLHVGDAADEARHGYRVTGDSSLVSVTSRYEGGVDHLLGDPTQAELVPETTDTGRVVTSASEATFSVPPDNLGVLLRRKLDYGLPDQCADVFVADGAAADPVYARAGTWCTPGSSTVVVSNPPHETDPPAPVTLASNRRWREDEFLVRRELTTGHSSLRFRFVVGARTPHPLLAGGTAPAPAWSEFRYAAYAWSLPSP